MFTYLVYNNDTHSGFLVAMQLQIIILTYYIYTHVYISSGSITL